MTSQPPQPGVVLVHGAYADGSSWSEVIERLQGAGLPAAAAQNPLISLADDVAHTRRILALHDGPVILAGHSFAGTVITEAGIDPRVAGLVYIAARAPDAGEDFAALAQKFPAPPASAGLVYTGGSGGLTEDAFLNDFANGVDPVRARVLYAVQGRVSESLFHERTTVAAWRSKPSWYAISRQDRTISPELQRFLAKRMNATTVGDRLRPPLTDYPSARGDPTNPVRHPGGQPVCRSKRQLKAPATSACPGPRRTPAWPRSRPRPGPADFGRGTLAS